MTTNNSRVIFHKPQDEELFFEWFCDHPIIHWGTGIMLVKNSNHEFIASNSVFSNHSGYTPKSLIGLNDEDMPWAENKDIYINHEKDILSGLEYNAMPITLFFNLSTSSHHNCPNL
ncbi:hypothetical protein [Pantoea sp.]|uniref:hypothetical protein n=1 Tax=Pantoea sp. TaxID=69393 RepID=UPI0028AE48CA|nr:hypothetical protein [Pantoea sp.]